MAEPGHATVHLVVTQRELRRYRPDVEGLRAVAILLVVFQHFSIPGFGGGFIGVDVFFVISGFVITSMLIRSSSSSGSGISLPDFFARRCRRIIPVATLVLLVSLTIERVLGGRAAAAALVQPGRLILLFVFNWDTGSIARLLIEGNPINAYWSLSVEEQFYLVFPVLLICTALIGRRRNSQDLWMRI
jgi:peptidoglycan/LPS O-acetylase OafA/YrhL